METPPDDWGPALFQTIATALVFLLGSGGLWGPGSSASAAVAGSMRKAVGAALIAGIVAAGGAVLLAWLTFGPGGRSPFRGTWILIAWMLLALALPALLRFNYEMNYSFNGRLAICRRRILGPFARTGVRLTTSENELSELAYRSPPGQEKARAIEVILTVFRKSDLSNAGRRADLEALTQGLVRAVDGPLNPADDEGFRLAFSGLHDLVARREGTTNNSQPSERSRELLYFAKQAVEGVAGAAIRTGQYRAIHDYLDLLDDDSETLAEIGSLAVEQRNFAVAMAIANRLARLVRQADSPIESHPATFHFVAVLAAFASSGPSGRRWALARAEQHGATPRVITSSAEFYAELGLFPVADRIEALLKQKSAR